jgi:peptidyl-prolyl cis-trans isomerase D
MVRRFSPSHFPEPIMIGLMRHALTTWPARLFFGLLVVVFVIWGIGDVFRNGFNTDPAIATVAGRSVDSAEVAETYRKQLSQLSRALGTDITPTLPMKKGIADQALDTVITQTALAAEVASLGLIATDDAVRQAVFEIPTFHGRDGKFDRNQFAAVLNANGLNEARFLAMVKADLGQRQLFGAVRAGSHAPDVLVREVYAFQNEKRVAEIVSLPFASVPPPVAPNEAQAARWYENHMDTYSTPEYRRIKLVVLSPDSVSQEITISEDDIKASYEAHKASFTTPERRSVQVILANDETKAGTLAAKFQAGADWAAMQEEASRLGASAVELNDAPIAEFPVDELAKAVFAAQLNIVPAPIKSPLGWHVIKVTAIVPGTSKTLAEMHDPLRAQLVADKAADLIYERANKLDDMLAGGTKLDELPADLGLAAATGTVDAQGLTLDGKPAPLPGSLTLHQILLTAAFAAKLGEPPHLIEAPRSADTAQTFYALSVEEITPPAPRPQAAVADQIAADFTQDAIRHTQEVAAAALLAEVKAGKLLRDAAVLANFTTSLLPAVGRATPVEGVPPQLIAPLFSLKLGEPTMVEVEAGFIVAVLSEVVAANPDTDAVGFGRMRDTLASGMADDLQSQFIAGVRERGQPRINRAIADRLVQPEN